MIKKENIQKKQKERKTKENEKDKGKHRTKPKYQERKITMKEIKKYKAKSYSGRKT